MDGLYRKVPIVQWLPKYHKSYFLPDLLAGVTVALTVIPQGIADSALAGLPPEYGLYSGFMGEVDGVYLATNQRRIFKVASFTAYLEVSRTSQLDQQLYYQC